MLVCLLHMMSMKMVMLNTDSDDLDKIPVGDDDEKFFIMMIILMMMNMMKMMLMTMMMITRAESPSAGI